MDRSRRLISLARVHLSASAITLLVLGTGAGCGNGPCGGDPPAIGECETGLFRADCGGTGPVTFGCSSAHCLWFATACVPQGFEASDCPYGDPCCHGPPGQTWPFADHGDGVTVNPELVEDIGACGDRPVTSSAPAPITVTVNPSTPSTVPSHVTCTGVPAPWDFCSATDFRPVATGEDGVTLRMLTTARLNPDVLLLEIVHVDATTLGARTFTRGTIDVGVAPYCESSTSPRPHLQFTGTLTLSSGDLSSLDTLHGRANLFAEGQQVVVEF